MSTTSSSTVPGPVRVAAPSRFDRVAVGLLAIVAVAAAMASAAQPILAGHLMAGNGAARLAHQTIGTEVLGAMFLLQAIAAALAFRRRPGRVWPLVASLLLMALLYVQAGWGFTGRVALHVPVGVAMVAAQIGLAFAAVRTVRRAGPGPVRGLVRGGDNPTS